MPYYFLICSVSEIEIYKESIPGCSDNDVQNLKVSVYLMPDWALIKDKNNPFQNSQIDFLVIYNDYRV